MPVNSKSDRLALRLSAAQKRMIERAAEVSGRTLTEFSVQAISDRAAEVLADSRQFELSEEQWNEFNRILDQPAREVPQLTELLRRPSIFDA